MPLPSLPRLLGRASRRLQPSWTSRLSSWLSSGMRPAAASEVPSHWQRKRRANTLAQARLEFAEALFDIHSVAAADLLDRIAISRSLPELWHLREQIFSLVACRHDQREAASRLKELDAHFPRRHRYATLPPPHPLGPSG